MTNAFHRVMHSDADDCFSARIKVPHSLENDLRVARDEIRAQIRGAFGTSPTVILDEAHLREEGAKLSKPKFRMQGSFSYNTQVDPAHRPPQQIDIDDGLFLPVSFITRAGLLEPTVASEAIFAIVEAALQPLCEERGWRLDTTKESCVRIELSDEAHTDMALYAVPDREFVELLEKAARETGQDPSQELRVLDEAYAELSPDHIMLAIRRKGWRRSDPRKLEDWFNDAVRRHGHQLRRVCRYLKSWRDFGDDKARLASIALMAVAVDAYDSGLVSNSDDRDDLALMAVADILPDRLNGDIPNPVVEGELLNQGWHDDEKRKFVVDAQMLRSSLRQALEKHGEAASVLDELRKRFGERIPEETTYVECGTEAPEKKAAALAAPYLSKDKEALYDAVEDVKASGSSNRPYGKIATI